MRLPHGLLRSVALRLATATLLPIACLCGQAFASCVDVPGDEAEAIRAAKRVTAVRITEAIILDGRLDERAWATAIAARDFSQQQPDESRPSTEPSEVRFLFDDRTLYVGGIFHDSDVEHGLITNELKRDFTGKDGDVVALVLDTFLDRRNAVTFLTNPGGAISDAQSHDDGRQINRDWNGIWFVRTGRVADGWTMEMAIPFKTLRFPDRDSQVWGLNVLRIIRRKNEITTWSPVPRQFTELKVSYAGVLDGIRDVRPGRNLRVKPYVTATGMEASPGSGASARFDGRGDGGLDLKYGRGGLTWDITYRSDFSQVEADEQQINLTRVSLFFPEKREFFLENQGAFRVGDQGASGTNGGHDLVPFFSRRIGLSDRGQPVPVRLGGRLTGKEGKYSVGVLLMSTNSASDGGDAADASGSWSADEAKAAANARDAAENYLAARVSREIGRGHSIGASYFGHESGARSNRVGELDVHLSLRRTMDVDAFLLRSETTGARGSQWAGRAALNWSESRHGTRVAYTNTGEGYQNDLGFVSRENAAVVTWEHEWDFRPRSTRRWFRAFTIGGEGEFVGDSGHDRLMSRLVRHDYSVEFPDGGRANVDLDWTYEFLTEPFEIARGVVLDPGAYEFSQVTAGYNSDRSRWLSGSVGVTSGDFWSGDIAGVEFASRVRMNEHVAVSAALERNHVEMAEGDFQTTLARVRLDSSLSTRMFLNALVQYNSTTRAWLTNVRFNLMHRPLSDVFIVLNDTRFPSGVRNRSIAFKFTHLLSF
jgi:hypothetical protein